MKKKPKPIRVYYLNPKSKMIEMYEVKPNTNKRSEKYRVVQPDLLPIPKITTQAQEIVAPQATDITRVQEIVAPEPTGTTSQDGSDLVDFSRVHWSNDDGLDFGTDVSMYPFF